MAKKRGARSTTAPGRPATQEGRRPTKAERKDQARREREEIRARMAGRRRNQRIGIVVLVVVAVGVVATVVLTRPETKEEAATTLPGLLTTTAPWPANAERVTERLSQIGLPAAGGAMHIHSHLDIYVEGNQVPVPADMGISTEHSAIHTHDDTGVLHQESAVQTTFTLGQVFDVWGVRFTPTCLGAYCAADDRKLRVFVDGEPFASDVRTVALQDEAEIVVAFGTKDQLPDPIPDSYDWSTLIA